MMMRHLLRDPPHLRARLGGAAGAPQGAGEIDARLGELGRTRERALEQRNALGDPVPGRAAPRRAARGSSPRPGTRLRERVAAARRPRPARRAARRARGEGVARMWLGFRCAHRVRPSGRQFAPAAGAHGYTRRFARHLRRGLSLPCDAMQHTSSARYPLALAARLCLARARCARRAPPHPDDWYRFQDLSDVRMAPDGTAVAYLVTTYDRQADESRGASLDRGLGGQRSRAAHSRRERERTAFQPGRAYLSFLSARPAGNTTQLWSLDRRGGKPRRLTHVSGEITSYEWSPDSAAPGAGDACRRALARGRVPLR